MINDDLKILGSKIRKIRESLNLTQHEFAKRAHVDRNYIGMLERGERNPSYLTLNKISKGIGMTITQILEYE